MAYVVVVSSSLHGVRRTKSTAKGLLNRGGRTRQSCCELRERRREESKLVGTISRGFPFLLSHGIWLTGLGTKLKHYSVTLINELE